MISKAEYPFLLMTFVVLEFIASFHQIPFPIYFALFLFSG